MPTKPTPKSAFHQRYAGWGPIVRRLKANELPDVKAVAEQLRGSEPLPREVRDYLADLLTGKIKGKPGRKRERSFRDLARNLAVEGVYAALRERFDQEAKARKSNPPPKTRRGKEEKPATPHQLAIAATADAFRMSKDWVVDRLHSERLYRKK